MSIDRRAWMKQSLLAAGAFAFSSKLPLKAANYDYRRVWYSQGLAEVLPPKMPDLDSLKARLQWNENPFGPSPKAVEAFRAVADKGNYYSWNTLNELMTTIAKKEGVEKENIIMGPGSSDLLEKFAMVYFQNGGNIVSADPSYMSLVNVAQAVGAEWKPVKLTKDYQHDLDAMEKAIDSDTKLVYITNPNNPTGTITDAKKLYAFCERVADKVPVFIDEAYLEISDNGLKDSMAGLVAQGKDVIVARTFSKIYGMAGLRLGYAVSSKKVLKKIEAITRGGMGVTGPTIAAGLASLQDQEFTVKSKELILESRKFTVDLLESYDIVPLPSQTNFVMFELTKDADDYLQKIYDEQVAVRLFKFWDKTWCRVSMGTMGEMKVFASAFEKAIA